ncbi:MAG: PQQ-dependent sugar dehydrogenase [Pseudomonadota bacterium]|nr:PQQ-dependent sugar dehydrogenase [Pseudomonadota bacterium]
MLIKRILKLMALGITLFISFAVNAQSDDWQNVDPVLPEGFDFSVFHPGLGSARHIAVRDNGDIYTVRPFRQAFRMIGQKASYGSLIGLRDEDGDGVADIVVEFGPATATTEVAIHKDYLYFGTNVEVFRIKLDDELLPSGVAEPIAGGFPMQQSHADKTFVIDSDDNLYVNSGTPSNTCESQSFKPRAPGIDPCPELDRSGGIWQFNASTASQDQLRDGKRYVTGTRNVIALEWNHYVNKLYFVMHGRDSVGMLWKDLYPTREENSEIPAEEFHVADEGDNFGWPYTFYDPLAEKRVQAPEYGGDGKMPPKGDKGEFKDPLIAFPAHWAPMDLLFHSGKNIPEKYAQGAFIVFHGSWNRMPLEQQGYNVVFVPMQDGKVTGDWEIFVDGLKGTDKLMNPGLTAYRPVGIAEGPDGELYLSEDKHGRIWRINWEGK